MRNSYRHVISVISIVLILILSNATVTRADVTGSVQGIVRDRSQGAIAGAQLTITNVDTNLKYQATTGADGSYRIARAPRLAITG